jgi:hypothetical protein
MWTNRYIPTHNQQKPVFVAILILVVVLVTLHKSQPPKRHVVFTKMNDFPWIAPNSPFRETGRSCGGWNSQWPQPNFCCWMLLLRSSYDFLTSLKGHKIVCAVLLSKFSFWLRAHALPLTFTFYTHKCFWPHKSISGKKL